MSGMKFPRNAVYLYRGLLPPTFNRCMGRMFTFGGYDNCLELCRRKTRLTDNYAKIAAALASGIMEGIICCPLERFQTILQDNKSNGKYKNTLSLMKELGFREYYRGIREMGRYIKKLYEYENINYKIAFFNVSIFYLIIFRMRDKV